MFSHLHLPFHCDALCLGTVQRKGMCYVLQQHNWNDLDTRAQSHLQACERLA